MFRGLNTNMARNEYNSFRVLHDLAPEVVMSTSNNEQYHFEVSIKDLANANPNSPFSRDVINYERYKVVNIQWVIQPLNLFRGVQRLETLEFSPYMLVGRPIRDAENTLVNPVNVSDSDYQLLLQSPGYRRYHLARQKAIVINDRHVAESSRTLIDPDLGPFAQAQSRIVSVGWDQLTENVIPFSQDYIPFARLAVIVPQRSGASDVATPRFRIKCYATVILKDDRLSRNVQ